MVGEKGEIYNLLEVSSNSILQVSIKDDTQIVALANVQIVKLPTPQ